MYRVTPIQTPQKLTEFLNIIRLNSKARILLVGGAVVDHLLGNEIKDWDIEVYGVTMKELTDCLENFEYAPKTVGEAFGVLKVHVGDCEIDVSIPRTENRIGAGHADFEASFDPNISVRDAARRRDLTINALAYDFQTTELIDEFDGLKDLRAGILRATDPEKFVEDPLRVLRIMQFLGRGKGTTVLKETRELCWNIRDEFPSLSAERVSEEFNKLLLKGNKPSEGLRFLLECGWLMHFPELEALVGVPQNSEWHPEGDCWEHTLAVVDAAAIYRPWIPAEWQLAFMYAALLHDVGKPATTDLTALTSHGHDAAGEEPTWDFMRRITRHKDLKAKVVALVVNHMQPYHLTVGDAKPKAWRRLHNKVRLDVLGWLALADRAASTPEALGVPHDRALNCWKNYAEVGGPEPIAAIILGRHLIAEDLTPGPEFGERLRRAYEAQVDNPTYGEAELLMIALKGGDDADAP